MTRYEEIMKAVCQTDDERLMYGNLVAEYVELERRLDELRALPQIKVHPEDPTRQKVTPAHKAYKELLQQYTNIAKILTRISGADEQDDESPMRTWAKSVGERMRAHAD